MRRWLAAGQSRLPSGARPSRLSPQDVGSAVLACQPNPAGGLAKQGFDVRRKPEGGEKVLDGKGGQGLPNHGGECPAVLNSPGQRQTMRRNREDDLMRIWPRRSLDRPFRDRKSTRLNSSHV